MAQITSTNLPIAIVTSIGTINDTDQVQGTLVIIDNASGVNTPTDAPKFNGMVGLRYRGNSGSPKKSLSLETWSSNSVSLDTSLLNMPSENDWVLLSAYEDRSLSRFMLSTKTVERMGRYSPRMRYCELILNNQYQGIYLFGERIKRDSNRVDIAKLTNIDISGINLTGGYILKVDGGNDGFTSTFPPLYGTAAQDIEVQIEYPDPNEIVPVQEAYIAAYIDSFEVAMNAANFQDTTLGWRKFAGVNTMADYMIITEVAKDFDAYRKNAFLYKDKAEKLRFGPIWGHDLAWKNTVDCNSASDTGWAFQLGAACTTNGRLAPFWWEKVTTDTAFLRVLKCTYTDYRKPGNALDTVKLFQILDSTYTYLNANGAVTRNFTQWPIWGVPIVNEPTPMATNMQEEMQAMKNFIKLRLAWLDTKWIQTTGCPTPIGVSDYILPNQVAIYPNPSGSMVYLEMQSMARKESRIRVTSMSGMVMSDISGTGNRTLLDVHTWAPGIYVVHVYVDGRMITKKLIKE